MCEYIESRPKQQQQQQERTVLDEEQEDVEVQDIPLTIGSFSQLPRTFSFCSEAGAAAIVCMHIKFNRMYSLHSMLLLLRRLLGDSSAGCVLFSSAPLGVYVTERWRWRGEASESKRYVSVAHSLGIGIGGVINVFKL